MRLSILMVSTEKCQRIVKEKAITTLIDSDLTQLYLFLSHLLLGVSELDVDLLGDLVLLGDQHARHFFDITEVQGLKKKNKNESDRMKIL